MTLKKTALLLTGLMFTFGCAHAHPAHTHQVSSHAGTWTFNPNKCPDLVEDRLDRREDRRDARRVTGVLDVYEDVQDRAENRRDEAVTRCPASAWQWTATSAHRGVIPPRPNAVVVFYNPKKAAYYRKVGHKTVVVRF